MIEFKKNIYRTINETSQAWVGADIGGTNSNFGLFQKKNETLHMIASYHVKSQTITDFVIVIKELLERIKTDYGFVITHMCIAAAGVVTDQQTKCKPTNLSFIIYAHELLQNTSLTHVPIVNDFEVIGYGLPFINPKDIVTINKGTEELNANKVIIGAGTGLGTCILRYSSAKKKYIPIATEAGHTDFASHIQLDFELCNYIQTNEHRLDAVSYEDVLSGNGIGRIYAFFCNMHKNIGHELRLYPDAIFNARNANEQALQTFLSYTRFYGRFAKNSSLAGLALAGVYIAGGIAAKNIDMFKQPEFFAEFIKCGKHSALLSQIPIFVITDYNVSIWGAVQYLLIESID